MGRFKQGTQRFTRERTEKTTNVLSCPASSENRTAPQQLTDNLLHTVIAIIVQVLHHIHQACYSSSWADRGRTLSGAQEPRWRFAWRSLITHLAQNRGMRASVLLIVLWGLDNLFSQDAATGRNDEEHDIGLRQSSTQLGLHTK